MPDHWRETNVSIGLLGVGAASILCGVALKALPSVGVDEKYATGAIVIGIPVALIGFILLLIGPKRRPMPDLPTPDPAPQPPDKGMKIEKIENSNVVNNQGSIQAGGNIHVGDNVHPPQAPPDQPTATISTNTAQTAFLFVKNNGPVDEFVIELFGFSKSGARMHPKWDDGQEARRLKRGEVGWAALIQVEPNRPTLRMIESIVTRMTEEIYLPAYKERIDKGMRLVRFFGPTDQDITVWVNKPYLLGTRVLSDHYAEVEQTHHYAVSDNSNLVLPFSQPELDRVNALGTAERDTLIMWRESGIESRRKDKLLGD